MFKIELRACHLLKNEKEYNKKNTHTSWSAYLFSTYFFVSSYHNYYIWNRSEHLIENNNNWYYMYLILRRFHIENHRRILSLQYCFRGSFWHIPRTYLTLKKRIKQKNCMAYKKSKKHYISIEIEVSRETRLHQL